MVSKSNPSTVQLLEVRVPCIHGRPGILVTTEHERGMPLVLGLQVPRQIADRVCVIAGRFTTGPRKGKFYTRRVRDLLRQRTRT